MPTRSVSSVRRSEDSYPSARLCRSESLSPQTSQRSFAPMSSVASFQSSRRSSPGTSGTASTMYSACLSMFAAVAPDCAAFRRSSARRWPGGQ